MLQSMGSQRVRQDLETGLRTTNVCGGGGDILIWKDVVDTSDGCIRCSL